MQDADPPPEPVSRKRSLSAGAAATPGADATTASTTPYHELFVGFRQYLDAKSDRRERLIKLSRDLTVQSKRLGFNLHRTVREDASDVLPAARTELARIVPLLRALATELAADQRDASESRPVSAEPPVAADHEALTAAVWQYGRAYTGGVQEFIESVAFLHYLEHRTLITPEQVADVVEHALPLSTEDYVLGVADLTGELMRYATNCVARGQSEYARGVLAFMRSIYAGFAALPPRAFKDYDAKLKVMGASVRKVEQLFYSVQVRGAERPAAVLAQSVVDQPPAPLES